MHQTTPAEKIILTVASLLIIWGIIYLILVYYQQDSDAKNTGDQDNSQEKNSDTENSDNNSDNSSNTDSSIPQLPADNIAL